MRTLVQRADRDAEELATVMSTSCTCPDQSARCALRGRHLRTQPPPVPMTCAAIADYTGLTTGTVGHVLGRLWAAKAIEPVGTSAVRPLDVAHLERLAEATG